MNIYAVPVLRWGIASTILGLILSVTPNLKTEAAMPIIGALFALAWVLLFASGLRKKSAPTGGDRRLVSALLLAQTRQLVCKPLNKAERV